LDYEPLMIYYFIIGKSSLFILARMGF